MMTGGHVMGAGFNDAIKICLSKYADFNGRAARPEFWFFMLFVFIVHVALEITSAISPMISHLLSILFSLAVLVPSLAVGARRLHDIGRSGWLQLIGLIPLIGAIILIYFYCQPGTAESNRFG
jgi:uncharacterized membrane protein YhaH (DUF805 family)